MTNEVIQECYTHLYYSPEINQESVIDIITEARYLRRKLITQINESIEDNPKDLKAKYRDIINELYNECIELVERLNSLDFSH